MRSIIILGAIIAFTIAGCLFFDPSYKTFACESSSGAQSNSQGVSNGASTGSQNAASSRSQSDATSNSVAQSGNRDGNGPSDFSLIDCDNPLFESLLPCRKVSRKANND